MKNLFAAQYLWSIILELIRKKLKIHSGNSHFFLIFIAFYMIVRLHNKTNKPRTVAA